MADIGTHHDGHDAAHADSIGHTRLDSLHAVSMHLDGHAVGDPHAVADDLGGMQLTDGTILWGDPVGDASHWHHQDGHSSCAVVAQQGVFESITGLHISEGKLCDFAQNHGWFSPDTGTPPGSIGQVLNALGVPARQQYGANLNDIADAIDRGDKIIVGLNANEIWHPLHDADGTPLPQPMAGHAVWVTGITVSPEGSATVYLNDSGDSHGAMVAVDARDFMQAWNDYGNLLVDAHAA